MPFKGVGVQLLSSAQRNMDIKSTFKKLEDGTIDFLISVPWTIVLQTKDQVITEHVRDAEVPGFRKGMAPKNMVEQSLSKDHVKEDILRRLLPQAYSQAIAANKVTPIVSPRINIVKIDDNADWEFHALTCEMPVITITNYKEEVKAVNAKAKVVEPGKPQQPVSFDEIAKILMAKGSVVIPSVIIESEVEKLLSQTLDEIRKLGLTLEQYLSSTGRTVDNLKAEFAKKAETDVKLEFILQQIAKEENIIAEEKEVNEAIATAKSDAERQNLEANKYLLASIIRQQKTLDFLRSL